MYGMAVRNAFTKPEEQATVRAEAFEIGVSRWPLLALEIKTLTDTYWVNFAKTGDPNGEGLPKWPVYTSAADQALDINDVPTVRVGVNKAGLDFFDTYYQSLKAPAAGGGVSAK